MATAPPTSWSLPATASFACCARRSDWRSRSRGALEQRMNQTDPGTELVEVQIPKPFRGAVALTYDTDMCHGYSPVHNPGCHGRTAPFVAEYMRRLMDTAEQFG